ncbi:MAG: C4-dicarboxylate ABC transporter substrate-binding protein, partial [Hyphomicrobiales bacterium]|nr:C4-dicarboxylate ABC transporter substrate-binding protein [Hyphomicrobiales bacterium]
MKASIAKHTATLLVTASLAVSAGAAYAEKWDMPLAYSATNFHSATAAEFAKCITTGTGGDIE